MDRSARSLLSVSALVLAVLLAMNYSAQEAAPLDWWPVLALALVAFLSWMMGRYQVSQPESVAAPYIPPPAPEILAPKVAPPPPVVEKIVAPPPPVVEKAPEPPPAPKAVPTPAPAPVVEKAAPPRPPSVVEKVPEPPPAPPESAKPAAKAAPAKKAAPKAAAKANDLTVIEGIGPKMSAALVAAGIDTYAKLSQSSEEALLAAVEAAGMRLAPSIPTWAEQAAYAAKGDMDGLKAFQGTLKGGRKK